ncbi:hypothetical protein ACFSFY_13905 [Sporosarcina siberiensis]|uniref:Sporulation lipoprotein YhcN/YlaJ (Spore_YhcN_YlaJ) n=1 Tax=Sporosarcina siberiensis TaxID=1365606 RepID=A0ABW4SHY0_9BACL
MIIISVILLLTGCNSVEKKVLINNTSAISEKEVEELFLKDPRLTNVVAVFNDKDILAGVTVKTFSRFKKAKIEKELKEKIENLHSELNIIVSADLKIIMETRKMMDEKDEKKLKKNINELKSLIKEET